MRYLLTLSVILLGGCNTLPPTTVAVPKEVSIAVAGKCIKKKDVPQVPEFPLDAVDFDGQQDLARLVNAARLERKARGEYVTAVQKVLEKCSEP